MSHVPPNCPCKLIIVTKLIRLPFEEAKWIQKLAENGRMRRRKYIYVKKKGSITSYVYSLIRRRKPKWIRAENDVILSGYRYPDKRRVVVELETLTEGTLVIEPKKKKQTNKRNRFLKEISLYLLLSRLSRAKQEQRCYYKC